MDIESNKKLLDRLARVEGQVRGLRNMLDDERACEDVLTQLLAARSGLESAGQVILNRHMQDCVLGEAELSEDEWSKFHEALSLWTRHAASS